MSIKKALRELTAQPKRTALVLFALILGVWGVGTVVVSYSILTVDLNENYQRTHAPHVILKSDNFDALNLADFTTKPEIETAEFRDFALERIEIKPNVWIPLWIMGVENFEAIQLAKLEYESGAKVPPSGSMLIERDGLKVSNFPLGSQPRIRVGGVTKTLSVSGICFDPAQAPATQDAFIYAYTNKADFAELTGQKNNKRLIVRLREVASTADVERLSQKLVRDFETAGIAISSVNIPAFNAHPHQWQLDTILLLVGAIGFLAFAMGGVLVSQLMRAIMKGQIKQIGILKSIGASTPKVIRIYLLLLLAIGVLAAVVAVPAAVASGSAYAEFVAKQLNFNILSTVPIWVYLSLIGASLALPVLLSFSTVNTASRISVKDALSDYGILQPTNQKSKRINTPQWLSEMFILALRNSLRNSRRLAVTILTMALGVAIFNTGFNVRQSLWELLAGVKNEIQYDVQVVLNTPIDRETALHTFEEIPQIERIECWVGGRGRIQNQINATSTGAGVIALPYSTNLLKLDIIQGHWIQPAAVPEIVMNEKSWSDYKCPELGSLVNLSIGDTIFQSKLVGLVHQFDEGKIYIDQAAYDARVNPQHHINTLAFVASNNDFEEVVALKKAIESAISSSSLSVSYVMSQAERVKIIYDHLNIILSTIVFLSFLVLLVSGVGMASATGISIWERTREIGVMRAIGATPKHIYSLFIYEGMLTSLISIGIGLLLAYPLSNVAAIFFGRLMLGDGAKLSYAFSPVGFVSTVVVTLLFGWLSSRLPAQSGIKIPTHQALSYE